MIEPDVGDFGVLEFYRGREAIAAGRAAARERLEEIKGLFESGARPQDASHNPVG
jgi:predicted acylesterase/phospholipase RssA